MISGDDLRSMRLKAGISQQAMSQKLECDRKTVINYELGVSDIPSKLLFKWFQCCKLDLSALMNQIKAVRGEASGNGQSNLLDFVTLVLILSPLWGPKIMMEIYIAAITLTACYGAVKKELNVLHIALILLFINLVDYIVFAFGIVDLSTEGKDEILHGSLVYGVQLLISIFAIVMLILRVQISRAFSNSSKIELTYFDGLFHWTFIYLSLIYVLAIVELFVRYRLEMHSVTIIHDNFKSLVYIGWAISCALLLTMVIVTEQKNKLQKADSL
ncbi:helix-turn-helix transcriptional regulator [Pseudoalteromonas sp. MMG022]|uniref:helix-turn-helix domain-containing protein n=1 Tax=Pseudoalteromonas sp. MMG022 TaxID=2909978 RepID=UPI001F34206A|nr:helix-turn-helix transcriptional regulator [Pseudoalteromonas sp. MMG022]MCF6434536.1 helix-turn-helix domain-containing protein [Pseudoalteromonas sp. MMG022]